MTSSDGEGGHEDAETIPQHTSQTQHGDANTFGCGTHARAVELASLYVRADDQQSPSFPDGPFPPRRSLAEDDDAGTAATTAALSVASLEDPPKSVTRIERENFLIFIKILFKVLDEVPPIKARAQRVVMECRRRSQQGDPNFVPLMDGVERHLRGLVGETRWRRSHLLLHHYIVTQKGRPAVSPTNRQQPTAILVGK